MNELKQALNLLSPQLRDNNIELQLKFDHHQIVINGVPDQIKQVFINIILNAVHAMQANGGNLNVVVSKVEEEVCIAFQDTGKGIPAENLEKIIEPFFTTKSKGTGLGLTICYVIIKGHQGAIAIDSTPGNGATSTICLPLPKG